MNVLLRYSHHLSNRYALYSYLPVYGHRVISPQHSESEEWLEPELKIPKKKLKSDKNGINGVHQWIINFLIIIIMNSPS